MPVLQVMRGRREPDGGDSKLIWDRNNPHEVKAARKLWKELKDQGFFGYRVKGDAGKGEELREFDPEAEKIIMTPPLVGG